MVCALYQTPPCDNLFLVYYMNEFPLFFCCVFLSMEITPVEDVNMGGENMKTIEVKRLGSSANVWLMFSNFKKTNKTIARQVQRRVCASYEYYLPKKLFWTDYFGFWTEFNSKWSGSLAFFRKHCINKASCRETATNSFCFYNELRPIDIKLAQHKRDPYSKSKLVTTWCETHFRQNSKNIW